MGSAPPLPRIEITEHAIRRIGVQGNHAACQQKALMATLRWGQGAKTVRVKGKRRQRRGWWEAGLKLLAATRAMANSEFMPQCPACKRPLTGADRFGCFD
jgi:hypothetical protein